MLKVHIVTNATQDHPDNLSHCKKQGMKLFKIPSKTGTIFYDSALTEGVEYQDYYNKDNSDYDLKNNNTFQGSQDDNSWEESYIYSNDNNNDDDNNNIDNMNNNQEKNSENNGDDSTSSNNDPV